MNYFKKNILILEHDPVLCSRFNDAFLLAGYEVQMTCHADEAMRIIGEGRNSQRRLDLVLVDISDKRNLQFVSDLLFIDLSMPVLMVKDALDKSLIIDSLNEKRTDFIEHFIESHAPVRRHAILTSKYSSITV